MSGSDPGRAIDRTDRGKWIALKVIIHTKRRMQELHQRFMLTLLEIWYGPVMASVTSTDLLQYGFDDAVTAPDPSDYI